MSSSKYSMVYRSLACPLLLILTAALLSGDSGQLDYAKIVRDSTFIFSGTVGKSNQSTVLQVKPSPSLVLVKVKQIITGPKNLAGYVGKDVTVLLNQPGSLSEGTEAIFFTSGWIQGNGVAVKEVAHVMGSDVATVQQNLTKAHAEMDAATLQTALKAAPVIVAGKVISVQTAQDQPAGNEHIGNGNWQDATVQVSKVVKGSPTLSTLHLLFPDSKDIVYVNLKKFKQGDTGIWLLQPTAVHGIFKAAPGKAQFVVDKPSQFLSIDKLQSVITLAQ